MSNKLSSVIYQYRQYKADQVLTHTQLNETIAYFEDQNRLSRVALTGVGIVHGFTLSKVSGEGGEQLVVKQGVGITTDGDLILLHQQLSEELPKENSISIDQLAFTHFRVFSDEKARYTPYFYTEEVQFPLWELCLETDPEAQPLADLPNWDGMNFLAYLECYPKSQDICGDINCDNQGIEQVAKLRFLMLEDASVEKLINQDDIFLRKSKINETLESLAALHLMKAVHTPDNSSSMKLIDKVYAEAINNGNFLAELSTGIEKILDGFDFLFAEDQLLLEMAEKVGELIEQVFNQEEENYNFLQYRYLLAKDLAGTYNSLVDALNAFDYWPNPKISAFPKHLLLGKLEEAGYRHEFYKSPTFGDLENDQNRIHTLLRKIYLLLDAFQLQTEQGLRIIPDGKHRHNQRFPSLPFYYANNEAMHSNWNFGLPSISFYYSIGDNPLLLDHDGQESYLIGGHLGADGEGTYQAINSMVSQFGLEFKVYHFDIALNQGALKKLFKDHPSCSAMAGVPKSGTYILLSHENKVFADLSLSYRVVDETSLNGSSHIRVASCTYPWISSLKYLNNLSRSLKGSVRSSGIQPKHYRLVINNYSINGQPIITGAVTLDIPLEAIYDRRMHAVTEALNERFPKGLVFDFDETLKRFVIKRPFDDEFSVTFTDITLSVNKPSYTFTQDGVVKSDKTFRLDAIRCEELRKYREATYLQLQTEFGPVNKDDDYGAYIGKWKEWNSLLEKLIKDPRFTGDNKPRIPESMADLPTSVAGIIRRVQSALNSSEIGHQLYLTGDWVTGSWASIEMINDYQNSTNTNDVIFRFLKLRSTLHKKEQATKASLFVVLNRETDRANMKKTLDPFTDLVDVYIETPATRGQPRTIDTIQKIRL